ncbi:MAG: peptidoglycan-binding protein, partial [Patescibacteria group bacterium]|nr:peptidoglycan-binding protein [Patescibacteria group bacterium]
MNKSQKAVALGLALTTGLWLFAGVFAAPLASAATSADIQAQINQLMAEIQTLQSQLGTSSSSSSSSYNFTRNLTVGSKGADVGALQQILINGGYLTAVSAPTNYFGSATKAALAKWQAANKVSPASGYFGPLTRAALASASGSTTTTGGSTGTTVVVPAGSGLSVSVASTNPAAANVALGAVATPLLALNFTAGSQAQTVTSLTLQRSGLSQDADLQNVYLYSGSTRIATDQSISNGNIVFTNASGLFTVGAGQMQTITVEADIYNGSSSASHVMALSVPAASD